MGVAIWIAAGLLAGALARVVTLGRTRRTVLEIAVASAASFAFGVIATALDFGGWAEADWRAGFFAFLGALAAAGAFRLVSARRATGPSPRSPGA